MSKSESQIVEELERNYPQGPPTDSAVRSQAFEYLPRHWTDRWPRGLPVPESLQTAERKRVRRSDLFIQAQHASSDEAILNFYVAMCGWGTGTKAQRVARCLRPLHEQGAVAALRRAYDAAQSQSPVEAYRRLNTLGEDRIKYFGPAFFTKWLYFSAYDAEATRQRHLPLILDARVASALGCKTSGWRSRDYGRYLDIVAQLSEAWRGPTEPLVIEYALFQLDSTTGHSSI